MHVGENPERQGLHRTPYRMVKSLEFFTSGYSMDPAEVVNNALFTEDYQEMIVCKNVDFYSLCEHHLLPFMGKAHVAYLPNGRIAGLSKLARAVEVLSRRPQVQERMTEELADLLMEELGARGVGVILEATHTCMTSRGVRKPGSITTTSAMRGRFRDNASTRTEFLALIHGGER
jgi:GTP cyclohydrolase I